MTNPISAAETAVLCSGDATSEARQDRQTITDEGAWTSGKKTPKIAFPLGKGKSYEVRAPFTWRLVRFECGGEAYRLLIYFRTDLEVFGALLGRDDGKEGRLVSRYEFHVSHGGWHLHADCEGVGQAGRTGGDALPKRLPHNPNAGRRRKFAVDSEEKALYEAYKAYGLLPRSLLQ